MSLFIGLNASSGTAVTGSLVYKGSYNATASSPSLVSAEKGDFYIVNVAGTLAGVTLNVGDHIVFNQNAANPVTSFMFDLIDNTESASIPSSETAAGIIEISTNAEATGGTATDKALVPSNISSIGTSQLNNDAGFLTSVAAASETVAGIIEISTDAEATTGTATDKALVPSNISSIGTSQLNNDAGFLTSVAAASETVAGKIEISTDAEATGGTATDKALVPSNISSIGTSQLNNDAGFLTSVAAASETVAGKIEISTDAEATGGTATDKALVPSNISSIGTSQLNNDAGFLTSVAAASETVAGKIEISTNAEATTGTATDKALVPSNISSIGTSQLNNDAGFLTSSAASETAAGIIEISTNAEATGGTATNKALVPSNISSIGTSQLNNDAGFLTSVAAASETVAGKIEISTNAEATTGTATNKALVPSNISSIGTSQLNNDAGFLTSVAAASDTVAGKIEISTNAEATTGTATDKALVPSNISSIGTSQLNNDAGFLTSSAASETAAGIIEIATNAEATTGTATNKALVPSNISSIGTSQLNNDAGFLTSVAAASDTVAGKIEISTNAEATTGTATDKALVPSNISSIGTSQLNNDAGFLTSSAASETAAGIIEIATNAEATTGTATNKALVPSNISSIGTSQLNNDAGFLTSVAAASETVAGKIEISTNAEATGGTATDKALVPSNISSIGTSQLNNDAGFLTSSAASETAAGIIEISTNAEATTGTATNKALVPSNISSIGTSQLNNDAGFLTSSAASETAAGIIEISTDAEATAGSATTKALVPSNISSIGTSQLNNDAGFLTSVAAASDTVAGKIEISTNAEATTGSATDKALVPSNISSIGTSQLNNDAGFLTSVAAASETVAGKIEISTNAEATTGTATDKALVPSNISSIGTSQLNNDAGFIASYTETDTLDDVVGRGATTSTPITIGDLKINSNAAGSSTGGSIATTASNNNILLDPHGSGVLELVGNATRGSGQVKLNCEQNSHGITLKGPPHSAAASYTMIFPDSLGTSGQVLSLQDASTGELSFITSSGGGGNTINVSSLTDSTQSLTYNSTNNEEFYYMTPTANRTVTLPSISGATVPEGHKINIKNLASSFNITVEANTSELIDATGVVHTISTQYESVTLVCDGSSKWYRV